MSRALACNTCGAVGFLISGQYGDEPPEGWEQRGLATSYDGAGRPSGHSWHTPNVSGDGRAHHRCPLCARKAKDADTAKDVRTIVREEVYGIHEEIAVTLAKGLEEFGAAMRRELVDVVRLARPGVPERPNTCDWCDGPNPNPGRICDRCHQDNDNAGGRT